MKITTKRLVYFIATCCSAMGQGSLGVKTSFESIEWKPGHPEVRVTIVLENKNSVDVLIPTTNLGPISEVNPKDGSIKLTFSHVPRTLRDGSKIVASAVSFNPVALKPGDKTVINYSIPTTSIRKVIVKYVVDRETAERYGFFRCDIGSIAE